MVLTKSQLTDGEKASYVRHALEKTISQQLSISAHPKYVLRQMMDQPSIVLAQFFDAFEKEGLGS